MHKFILYILCELVYCVVQTGYRKPCKCAMLVSQLQYCESPLYGQAGQRYELLGTYYSHITVFLMFPGSLRYIYHTCSAHILYSMPSCANYRFLQKLWSHVWLLRPLTNCLTSCLVFQNPIKGPYIGYLQVSGSVCFCKGPISRPQ